MCYSNFPGLVRELVRYRWSLPISYSRLKTMRRCPFNFHENYVIPYDQRVYTPSREAQLGTAMHTALEKAVTNCKTTGSYTINDSQIFSLLENVNNEFPDQKAIFDSLRDSTVVALGNILEIAKDYPNVNPEKAIATSRDGLRTFDAPGFTYLRDSKYVSTIGFIDLELANDKEVNIFDYKTEYLTPEREEEVKYQMNFYAWTEFSLHPRCEHVKTFCVYLKSGEIVPSVEYTTETKDLLQSKVLEGIATYLRSVKKGFDFGFEKTPNNECKYCRKCELFKE